MGAAEEIVTIGPQPGPQTEFLSNSADIVIYGGAAFGGKTFALLLQPLAHVSDPGFTCVTFRRLTTDIEGVGGMWDESMDLYTVPGIDAKPNQSKHWYSFPSGAKVSFNHMQHEKDRFNFKGWQISLINFDQLETFTWKQFEYMMSRNRNPDAKVHPYIRATCNPIDREDEVGGWLRDFIDWWIDEGTGKPIEERSGVHRHMMMGNNDQVEWFDEPQLDENGDIVSLSVTFIPAKMEDNQIGMTKDPDYKKKLMKLSLVERERLLHQNWNIRYSAGMYYQREWFKYVRTAPPLTAVFRYWDTAATDEADATANSSRTACVKMGIVGEGDEERVYILDVHAFRSRELGVKRAMRNMASEDGKDVFIAIEQEPGGSGKSTAERQVAYLAGYNARRNPVREDKGKRALPLSAQVEAGNVFLVRGPWNQLFVQRMQNFDGTNNSESDEADAASGAYQMLQELPKQKTEATW
jgi:predicted phage terminase large subunit-like protein